MDAQPEPQQKLARPLRRRKIATGCVLLFFAFAYFARPDALQAMHWWPMPLWTPIILLPWLSLRPWRMVKPIIVTLGLWALLSAFLGELPTTLAMPKDSSTAQVVSLNCGGGLVEAAEEAFQAGADLVLLQEVGNREAFVARAKAHGYKYAAWSFDDAIFAHTPLTEVLSERDFVAATWTFADRKMRVVSLRLHPPTFRLDLWKPECWRTYAEDTRERRQRFEDIARRARLEPNWVVGGDFNATNPRIVTDVLPSSEEAMRTRGTTWLGTGSNDMPLAPVDQIWANRLFWNQAEVRKTRNSDHRMVVAETTPFY